MKNNLIVIVLGSLVVGGLCVYFMSHLSQSNKESCAERLSLISKAAGMYCNDYDGWYPHVSTQSTESTVYKFAYQGSHELWSQAMSQYIDPRKLVCPVEPNREYVVSMALVPRFFGTMDGVFKLNEKYMPNGYPLNRTNTPYVVDTVVESADGKRYSSHGDSYNILYLDGHIESEKLN